MDKIILFAACMAAFCFAEGQAPTAGAMVPIQPVVDTMPYDSSVNFLAYQPQKYLGQQLYLCGLPASERNKGYPGFYQRLPEAKPTVDEQKQNIYLGTGGLTTPAEAIAFRNFKVLEVLNNPDAGDAAPFNSRYFKLMDMSNNQTLYYFYHCDDESAFPFITAGYLAKAKQNTEGMGFVFPNRSLAGIKDMDSSKPITLKTGDTWTCTELKPDEQSATLLMVIENSNKQKITVSYSRVMASDAQDFVLSERQAKAYKETWGEPRLDSVLQGIVVLGMTSEMCQLALGKPENIDRDVVDAMNITETWTYPDGRKITLFNYRITEIK